MDCHSLAPTSKDSSFSSHIATSELWISIFQAIDKLVWSWRMSSSMETLVILDFPCLKIPNGCSTSGFWEVGVAAWQFCRRQPKTTIISSLCSNFKVNGCWSRRSYTWSACENFKPQRFTAGCNIVPCENFPEQRWLKTRRMYLTTAPLLISTLLTRPKRELKFWKKKKKKPGLKIVTNHADKGWSVWSPCSYA